MRLSRATLLIGWSVLMGQAGAIELSSDGYPSNVPLLQPSLNEGRSLFWHDPYCKSGKCGLHDTTLPTWYGSVEFLTLYRDQNGVLEKQPLVPGGTLALGTEDLDAEFKGGARFLIGRSIGECYRLEATWLGDYKRSDATGVRSLTEQAAIEFDSQFRTGELNLRRSICLYDCFPVYGCPMTFSTLLGIRYVENHEELQYSAQANGSSSLGTVQVTNDMFGIQVGALSQLLVYDCAWIEVEAKGALLTNDVNVNSVYAVTPGGVMTFGGNEHRTGYLADVSVVLNYQFAAAWTMRIGYNAIWLGGQALGSMNTSGDPTIPPADIDHSGEVIYHGPSLGLVFTF